MMSYEEQVVVENVVAAPAAGRSYPLGATLVNGGANFSVFSRSASSIELLFFDRVDDARPSRIIPIDPLANRTYHYWHVFVPDVQAGQIYGFRAHGPFEPAQGLRFDPSKLLLDPYGRAIAVPKHYSREGARLKGDNTATAMKSVVTDPHAYDWEGDAAAEAALVAHNHLRDACARFHRASELRAGGIETGHIRRTGREDPIPSAAGYYCGRAASGVSIRSTGCACRPDELLGLLTGLLLCPAPGIQLRQDPLGALMSFEIW